MPSFARSLLAHRALGPFNGRWARWVEHLVARAEYGGAMGFVRFLRALPLDLAVRVGAASGGLLARLARADSSIARRNLEIAFPDLTPQARLQILRESNRNWGRMIGEWAHFDKLNAESIWRFATLEGERHLKDAESASDGRGVLLLTAHFGNHELLPLAASIYGYRIAIIHHALRNRLLDDALCGVRTRFGNRIIERRRGAHRIASMLKRNWKVGVMLDVDARDGVFVDFFSLKASTSPGPARFAMAFGSPVLPCFIVRDGEGTRHRVIVQPPIEVVKTRDREEAVRENTQRFVDAIEAMVRQYPEQWTWTIPRWKRRPNGEPRFY